MQDGFKPGAGTVVVTGAASGIGRAIARRLSLAGAPRTVLLDRDGAGAARAAEAIGPHARAMGVDVRDPAAIEAAVTRIEEEDGPISLWCSNAGVHRGQGLGNASDWDASLAVNLHAHLHSARAVLPRMARRGTGHFVITASAAGLLTDPRCAPYSVSKHAAVALAEWLAIAHGDDGVTVACLCPEGVRTAMTAADSAVLGAEVLEPEAVAGSLLEGLAEGRFLILPHTRTAEYERRRAADRDRWIAGMRRARRRAASAAPLYAAG
ncbi:SDR family NAD(P)-dependent oxidoreductase [Roseomonas populi]|uniref:SDR family oxidoreductase n=1 Tax=Roseomonas populi TaxID=3121582 RepID=A0ABT1X9Y4_9PROT|nr:SDR family oxidoreductase [Roseomonas pecuniae]MCR0984905.1 SDR family oxidoreductase [Roseomonas pecuniae]